MAGTAPVVRSALGTLRRPDRAPQVLVEHTVLLVCAGVLAVALLWLAAGVAVCFADAFRHGAVRHPGRGPGEGTGRPGRAGVLRPRLARALVAVALGSAATGASPSAANARTTCGCNGLSLPGALDGLPLPERPYGGVRTHEVRPGDSLWSIAEAHLPRGAGAAEVARSWPVLHRLNRDRIGPDPHLIRPGTTLRLPVRGTAPTRGAAR